MTTIYRISSSRFSPNSGAGAAKFGGRWNRAGTGAIYAAQSPSLAALELLVCFSVLPKDYILTEILIPEVLGVLRWDAKMLPAGWNSPVLNPEIQALGEKWVQEGRYALLSVPSSLIPSERIYVINPEHSSFSKIVFRVSHPFRFDHPVKH